MKSNILLLLVAFLFSTVGSAEQTEELYSLEKEVKPKAVIDGTDPQPTPAPQPARQPKIRRPSTNLGNLPQEFLSRNQARLEQTTSLTILPDKSLKSRLKSLPVGEALAAYIPHSIIAFPDEKAPVIATLKDGSLSGHKVIGYSELEPNSKRIFLHFHTIVDQGRAYKFEGAGSTITGQTGFIGEYHSQEGKLFAGEFLSAMVAAYFDGLVARRTNVFGTVTEDNSVDSAFKKGLSAGAMSTAQRFREKLKNTPEFSELRGPVHLKVLVLEPAIEK